MSDDSMPVPSLSRRTFALRLAFAFVLLTAPRLVLHEVWRDEAWLWLVARESQSLTELVTELSRSGQGYLFPVACWLTAHLSHAPLAMQMLNLGIVTSAVYVLARWSPFRPLETALIAFGYYVGYEYGVLSRHYGLGTLLLFVACAAARSRARWAPLLFGLAIALACQTTVYAFIVAMAIVAFVVVDGGLAIRSASPPRLRMASLVPAAAIIALGVVAGLVQLVPEEGTPFAVAWHFGWERARLLEALQIPWRAFFPVPVFRLDAWNTDILESSPVARAMAGLTSLGLGAALLAGRRRALLTFAVGALGVVAFGYVKYVGSLRHHGHVWIAFLLAAWLSGGLFGQERSLRDAALDVTSEPRAGASTRTPRERVFLAVLVVQCALAFGISALDVALPFSNGARAAAVMRARGLDRYVLLGYREPPAAPVSLALGKPMFAPSHGTFSTHTDWGPLQRDLEPGVLRCSARALSARIGDDVVMVMNTELPPWPELQREADVAGSIVPSESYVLYRLRHDALARTAGEAACAARP